jgi:hypothetical protein
MPKPRRWKRLSRRSRASAPPALPPRLNCKSSLEFLLNIIATDTPTVAIAAFEALTIYRHVESARSRVEAVVKERNNAQVTAAHARTFAP